MNNRTITVYRPGSSFPSVSVTGRGCDLLCDHCRGVHLKGMVSIGGPDGLLEKALAVKRNGGTGLLISGGCDLSGRVPLMPFTGVMKRISEAGLEMNIHAGLVDGDEAKRLVDSGVSVFSVDVHQDPEVIRNVLHLDRGPEVYGETIDAIVSAGGRVVPHLTVGFGTADLTLSAEMLKCRNIRDVTLLALVPADGTEVHANIPRDVVVRSALMLQDRGFEVTLGCMRERDHLLEKECITAGVRKIANPSLRTVRWAEENGFTVTEIKKCCSF